MVIFSWNKDLESGIESIDTQHRELIDAANQFFIRYKCGQLDSAAEDCLRFIQGYILTHFEQEEALMLECGYPKYQEHRAIHEAMTKKAAHWNVRLTASDYAPEEVGGFHAFLCDWLLDHILIQDLAFSRFYHDFNSKEK